MRYPAPGVRLLIFEFRSFSDFESVLNSIKWPYLGAAAEPINPPKDSINRLMMAAEYLFLVSQIENQSGKNHFSRICATFS